MTQTNPANHPPTSDWIAALIHKLPLKAILLLLSLYAIVFLILLTTALTTNRSVDFWPPHVGTDRGLLAEMTKISTAIAELRNQEFAHLQSLEKAAQAARDTSLKTTAQMAVGMTEADLDRERAERAVGEEKQVVFKKLDDIQLSVQRLYERVDGINPNRPSTVPVRQPPPQQ